LRNIFPASGNDGCQSYNFIHVRDKHRSLPIRRWLDCPEDVFVFWMFARVFDFNFDFAIKGLFETPADVGGGGENSLPPLLF